MGETLEQVEAKARRKFLRVDKYLQSIGVFHGFPLSSDKPEEHPLIGNPDYELAAYVMNEEDKKVREKKAQAAQEKIEDTSEKPKLEKVYSWRLSRPWKGRHGSVFILKNREGRLTKVFVPEVGPERRKLQMIFDTTNIRGRALFVQAENKAQRALKGMIDTGQWRNYILDGMFMEQGESGVSYVLRKGRPTLALRASHFLAALCLHPLAYYDNTWAGSLPPTDEVIAHLWMIRSDEHYFWRKSEQHLIEEVESGI